MSDPTKPTSNSGEHPPTQTSGMAPLGHLTTELRSLPERPPDRIGRYRILHELGHGGMGSVLLAIRDDDQFKKRVAIKLIKRGMDTREVLKRFDLERQLLSALNHPHIARLLDGGQTDDGRPYFVLEYIEGLPIDQYCDTNNLPITERVKLFRKVCAAVQYAHQNLIVHRDLKPGNILVSENGEPKLLDFGIAKMLNPELFNVTIATGPEMRLMTPEYASPEQVQGQPISTSSDVYSLGVLLYELLTGHRPYKFRTRLQNEMVRIICEVEPERPSTAISREEEVLTRDGATHLIRPEEVAKKREGQLDKLRRRLRGDLDNILLKALHKAPKRRYATVEQFSMDLEHFLGGMPVIAQPDTWGYRASKFVRRHRLGVASAASILILLVAGITGTTWQWRKAKAAEAVAQRRSDQFSKVVDAYMDELKGALGKAEGATVARKVLTATALKATELLQKEGKDDPQVRRKLANVFMMMGDVQGGVRSGNEGSQTDALASYQKALAIRKELASAAPSDASLCREVAGSLLAIADSQANLRQRQEAIASYQECVNLARRLVADAPADRDLSRFLATSTANLADQLLRDNKPGDAAPLIEESLSIRKKQSDSLPGDETAARDLSVGLNRKGSLLEAMGKFDEAATQYRASLEIRLRQLARESNARTKRDVATTQERLGSVLIKLNRIEDAEKELAAASQIIHGLLEADPNDGRLKGDETRIDNAITELKKVKGQKP